MSETFAFKIYKKLPVCLQNVACCLQGFKMLHARYNKVFYDFLDFLEESQWWSYAEMKAYQDERLKEIIRHCYDTVPYYQKIMDARKLSPDDIRKVEDLEKLPVLTKDIIRNCPQDFICTTWPKSRIRYEKTGGTTGKSLRLQEDIDTNPRQWAVWWRHRHRFGLDINDEFIVFAGRDVVPLNTLEPPFWRRNLPMKQTYISVHHMTKNNMPCLVDYLSKRNVKYYSAYPSGIYLLARYMLDNDIHLPNPPKVIILGAETLLPHQRIALEQAFDGAIVTDQYGACEQCGNISDCEKRNYHVDMEFGVIEFLPLEGMPSNLKKIICTGFWNPVMPLVRYEIGDIATLPSEPLQCECGRKSPIVKCIDGRIESYILTPDGRQLGRLDFLFKTSSGIDEAQLIQDDISEVIVRVVKNSSYTNRDEQQLLNDMKKYLGEAIKIKIEYLSAIPRMPNGKFRQIVSSIFRDKYSLKKS